MRLVMFGIGQFYELHKHLFSEQDDVVAFIDNDESKWGKCWENIEIHKPKDLYQIDYDYIVITCLAVVEIRKQLLEMNIPNDRIWYFEQYKYIQYLREKSTINITLPNKKSILFVYTDLCNDGGTTAVWNAAKIFVKNGYYVCLAVMNGIDDVVQRISDDGIEIIMSEWIDVMHPEGTYWIKKFDYVVVNTVLICNFAFAAAAVRPIIWWLHDPLISYRYVYEVNCRGKEINFNNMQILAVSDIAKRNFKEYFPNSKVKILPCSVSRLVNAKQVKKTEGEIVFAFVGSIVLLKGIDILLDALDMLDNDDKKRVKLLIAGNSSPQMLDYLNGRIRNNDRILYLGELDRDNVDDLYTKIDVLVCPSREETLSLVSIEAMQHERVCIVSSNTGIAGYIDDNVSGIIFKNENIIELRDKLIWVIKNHEKLAEMGKKANEVYLDYFSENAFFSNFWSVIQ